MEAFFQGFTTALLGVNLTSKKSQRISVLERNSDSGSMKFRSNLVLESEWGNYRIFRDKEIATLGEAIDQIGSPNAQRLCMPASDILLACSSRGSDFSRAISGAALAVVARGMDRANASRVCGTASKVLLEELISKASPLGRAALAEAIFAMTAWLDPKKAAKFCAQAAEVLAVELQRSDDESAINVLAEVIAMLAQRMDRSASARLCLGVLSNASKTKDSLPVKNLSQLIGQIDAAGALRMVSETVAPKDAVAPAYLADGLAALAVRDQLSSREGIQAVLQCFDRAADADVQNRLATAISIIARKWRSPESVQACNHVVQTLRKSLATATDASGRTGQVQALAEVVSQIPASEAARVCEEVLNDLFSTPSKRDNPDIVIEDELATSTDVSGLLPFLDSDKSSRLARELAYQMCSKPGAEESETAKLLDTLLCEPRRSDKAPSAAEGSKPPISMPSELPGKPNGCRLTTEQLVELLKMPTCFGETRRVVLNHLGSIHGRRFTNHWQFVRFAKERKLDLDFTTPPKRPDPAKSREAIIKALKGE
jgi:hypothetical protein